jgi:hypothetical protein
MGLRIRKSISLGKGVRLNVGKSGVGVSFGTRGLRYSINSSGRRTTTVGIPGTGLSYSTSTGARGKRNYSSNAYNTRQRLQEQRQQQKLNEVQQNKLQVEEYNNYIEVIKGVHKECDDFVDWTHLNSINPPFIPPQPGLNKAKAVREFEDFSPKLIEKIFRSMGEARKKKLEAAIAEAEKKDREEYEEWKSLNLLSGKILQGDIDAYLQVIEEMNPLDDLLEFGSDFEFEANNSTALEVEFRVKSDIVAPKEVLSLTQTGKLSRKVMPKTKYYELVQDYVCSCTIRIARDIMALLPVEKVIVHAVDNMLNTTTGFEEEITILSVVFDRNTLNSLNFDLIDPSDALQNFRCNMRHLKTGGFKSVERITEY